MTATLLELDPLLTEASPTLLLAATNWQAMSTARLASSGVRTVPLRTAALPAISARMLEPGTNLFRMSSRPLRVGADGDLQQQDLLALGVEEEGVGLALPLGDEEYAVRRLHDRVDLVGVGNEHVFELEGKLHQ